MGMIFLFSRANLKKMKKVVSTILPLLMSVNVWAAGLPEAVLDALQTTKIDPQHLVVSVRSVHEDPQALRVAWQDNKTTLPASSAKIVTTLAALDILGPAYRWETGFYHDGEITQKTLKGNLWIKGGGDPHYVAENLWRDAMRLKALGIERIEGQVYIDRTLFNQPAQGNFDANTTRPYNLQADAALYNYSSVVIRIRADQKQQKALLSVMPPLRGMQLPESIRLKEGACSGWKQQLQAKSEHFLQPVFNGAFPSACEEKVFTYTVKDTDAFWQAALGGIFDQVGIVWNHRVQEKSLPENARWLLSAQSEDLAQMIRYTNKWSNNVLARHIFLTLGDSSGKGLNYEKSRHRLQQWLTDTVGLSKGAIYLDNGSGLSRRAHVSARAMTDLLRYGYFNVRAAEWFSSFPISATDGTMKRRYGAPGQAYMKTGYLNEVKTMAGIVQSRSGRRYVVYAGIEDKKASQGNPVLDALLQWLYEQG